MQQAANTEEAARRAEHQGLTGRARVDSRTWGRGHDHWYHEGGAGFHGDGRCEMDAGAALSAAHTAHRVATSAASFPDMPDGTTGSAGSSIGMPEAITGSAGSGSGSGMPEGSTESSGSGSGMPEGNAASSGSGSGMPEANTQWIAAHTWSWPLLRRRRASGSRWEARNEAGGHARADQERGRGVAGALQGLLEAANKKADLQDEVLARTKRRRKGRQNCRMR